MKEFNSNINKRLEVIFKYDFLRNLINPSILKLCFLFVSFSVVCATFASIPQLYSMLDNFPLVIFSTLIIYTIIVLLYTEWKKRRITKGEFAYITDSELFYKSGTLCEVVIPHKNIIRCELKRKSILDVGEITIYTDMKLFTYSNSIVLDNIKNFEEVFENIKDIMLKDETILEHDNIEIHPTFIVKYELLKLIMWLSVVMTIFILYRNAFESPKDFEYNKIIWYFWLIFIMSGLIINFILKKINYRKTNIRISEKFLYKMCNKKEMLKVNKEPPRILFDQNFLEEKFKLGKLIFTFYDEIKYVNTSRYTRSLGI